MSIQMAVWPHKCRCGYEWIHTTTHSTTGAWINPSESDKVTNLIIHKISFHRFCLKCVNTDGIRTHDYGGEVE